MKIRENGDTRETRRHLLWHDRAIIQTIARDTCDPVIYTTDNKVTN